MLSSLEDEIHQNIICTSDRCQSIHINKNSSIGLKNFFTDWCRNNRRRSAWTTKFWLSRRPPILVMLRTSWYPFVIN